MKTLKMLTNLGSADQHLLKLPEAYMDGQVVDVDDDVAGLLCRRGWAKEYDHAAKRGEERQRELDHEAAIQRAMPAARLKLAEEEATALAVERLRNERRSPLPEPQKADKAKASEAAEIQPLTTDLATAAEAGQKVDKFAAERAKNK